MKAFKTFQNVLVDPNSKLHELLESKKSEDQKKAKRLYEYVCKAADCHYNYDEVQKLRKQFNDIL